MGLSWQQGPLSAGAIGHFLTPEPLPQRLLFAEWLRRRMRVKFNDTWIADSENVIVLHEPGRYRDSPYFPREDVDETALVPSGKITHHKDLGDTAWYTVHAGDRATERAAWEFTSLPGHAAELDGRIDFAWRAMDAFYEEADRILGHAADAYHRIDIRNTDRTLEVRVDDTVVARSEHPVVLYESGFAPRWYVPRADIDEKQLRPVEDRPSVPTRACATTTTSATRTTPHGPTATPTARSPGSRTWCRSSRTGSRCFSTASAWNPSPGSR
ncbi:DUF427 domain-containing protein [Streptomyces sp. NBC_00316]|nr:DUF427 domain-containing protein [Streptomyces sp. NBC_00316]